MRYRKKKIKGNMVKKQERKLLQVWEKRLLVFSSNGGAQEKSSSKVTSARAGLLGITTGDETDLSLETLWKAVGLFDCTGSCRLNTELVLIFAENRQPRRTVGFFRCVGGWTPGVSQILFL